MAEYGRYLSCQCQAFAQSSSKQLHKIVVLLGEYQ